MNHVFGLDNRTYRTANAIRSARRERNAHSRSRSSTRWTPASTRAASPKISPPPKCTSSVRYNPFFYIPILNWSLNFNCFRFSTYWYLLCYLDYLADVEFQLNLLDTTAYTEKRKELEVAILNPHNHPVKWFHNSEPIEPNDRYEYSSSCIFAFLHCFMSTVSIVCMVLYS